MAMVNHFEEKNSWQLSDRRQCPREETKSCFYLKLSRSQKFVNEHVNAPLIQEEYDALV